MNVLVVEPGFLPYEKEIPDSLSSDDHLRALQEIVGGYIEAIYPYEEEVAIVCNEEGLINGLPFNRSVPGGYGGVFGTFFICGPVKVSFVDKKQHFNTLVSRFEVFLKKVYYLRNHTTIVSTKPGSEGQKATLADCIYQTPCLKRLKYSEDENDKKFYEYLSKVRDWRNDNAHKAPTATEQECDEAINILTSIYLYVVAFGIRSRELFLMATEVPMQTETMPMAAEPPVEPDNEKKRLT